jgi:hypothetical protein
MEDAVSADTMTSSEGTLRGLRAGWTHPLIVYAPFQPRRVLNLMIGITNSRWDVVACQSDRQRKGSFDRCQIRAPQRPSHDERGRRRASVKTAKFISNNTQINLDGEHLMKRNGGGRAERWRPAAFAVSNDAGGVCAVAEPRRQRVVVVVVVVDVAVASTVCRSTRGGCA